jgi:hypothetical protein
MNLNLVAEGSEDFSVVSPESGAFFSPLGSAYKVRVTDSIMGDEFEMTLLFLLTTEYNKFKAMRDGQRTLLLRNPESEQWFIRFDGDMEVARAGFGNTQRRMVKVKAIEVAPPSSDYVKFVPSFASGSGGIGPFDDEVLYGGYGPGEE